MNALYRLTLRDTKSNTSGFISAVAGPNTLSVMWLSIAPRTCWSSDAYLWQVMPATSRSTRSGGSAIVMPFVISIERGATCLSDTHVWLKKRIMPQSVRPPPPAQFSKITFGKRVFRRRYSS